MTAVMTRQNHSAKSAPADLQSYPWGSASQASIALSAMVAL
jgi:hypothetical protein